MKKFSDRGFVKIRRAFREHLSRMSSDSVKLYLWLHLVVFWSGKQRGIVETNYTEIAQELRWTIIRVKRAMTELRRHYVKVSKRGNQHGYTLIRILKYQKRTKGAGITRGPSRSAGITGEPSYDTSSDTSTSKTTAKTQAICSPKKAVEGSRSKAAAGGVWDFLEIAPCGHPEFQKLLESCWSTRNGEPSSLIIGRCLDAWRDVGEEGDAWKRGLPPLFHAVAALRKKERLQEQVGASQNGPGHSPAAVKQLRQMSPQGRARYEDLGIAVPEEAMST
jgi:hypothetical protein